MNYETEECEAEYEVVTTEKLIRKLNYYEGKYDEKYHPEAMGGYEIRIS